MVKIADVTDRGTLKSFLDAVPDAHRTLTARRIAYLSAARVAPLALRFFAERPTVRDRDLTPLPLLTALSYSGVAAIYPTPEYAAAAAAAANAAAYWSQIRADLTDLMADPFGALPRLWPDAVEPEPVARAWHDAKSTFAADKAADWSVFILLIDRMRAGQDIYAPELARILYTLTHEDIEGDPAAVLPRFEPLLALYRAEDIVAANPYGWRVTYDTTQRKLASEPTEVADLEQIIEKIRQSLKDFTARCRRDKSANNMGQVMKDAFAETIQDLRRDLKRHQSDPQGLFEALGHATAQMDRIAKAEVFPADAPSARLVDEITLRAEDTCYPCLWSPSPSNGVLFCGSSASRSSSNSWHCGWRQVLVPKARAF
ncbi:MAG: hypothetical protein AAGF60_08440 [Pseudomonadota bacterium]